MLKKYNCGELGLKNVGEEIKLFGWVSKSRRMGGLIFIDLRDRYGITQLIVSPKDKPYLVASELRNEYVIEVTGKVCKRKSVNSNISTGNIEIFLKSLVILNKSDQTPLIIKDKTDALEDTRLIYRYLDLRRPVMQNKIIIKSKFLSIVRNYFENNKFIEIETPILTKTTPEGARDFIVPSRLNKNKFFALPQSPQLFKQLLMISGFDRYYQVAKCFRDEDLRSDRQPEFLQIDAEISFTNKEEIMKLIEKLLKKVMYEIKNIKIDYKFPIIKYDDAIDKYGSDKPDIRIESTIKTLDNIFKNTSFKIFNKILLDKKTIRGIFIPYNFSKKELEKLSLCAKQNKAFALSHITVNDKKDFSGPINKFISAEEKQELISMFSINTKGTILIVADTYKIASQSIGAVRVRAADIANMLSPDEFKFLWVVDWPLFEVDEKTKKCEAMHHPFTSPDPESKIDFSNKFLTAHADAYDIVLNGCEIGGGSIRIHDRELQSKIFNILGISENTIKSQFGWFLKAFTYGVPPHGGIALGVDRIIMILTGSSSIRDTIAFPKNANGIDLMSSAPSEASIDQLYENNIKVVK